MIKKKKWLSKPKPQKQINSPVKREFSAGGVVWKKVKEKTLFLIIQPKGTDRWQFPKGHIEKGESSKDAAIREVFEEGGVVVKINEKLVSQQYFFVWDKERIFKIVVMYLLEYLKGDTKDYGRNEVANALFLELDEALEKLTFKRDKEVLHQADIRLKQGLQESLV